MVSYHFVSSETYSEQDVPAETIYIFFLFRNLTCAILKLVAQIMLCLKLELENSTNHPDFKLPLYYVMIPIWIILPVALVDIFFTMYYQTA